MEQGSTCAEDAFAISTFAPMQHCAAWEMPSQAQQPRSPKELLLIPCSPHQCKVFFHNLSTYPWHACHYMIPA